MASSACSLPEARRTARRRGRDLLLFYNDLFVLWDCCAGFLFGYLTDIAYMQLVWHGAPLSGPPPVMLHEMVLCSVVAALILREPKLATDRRLLGLTYLIGMLLRRGFSAISVLLLVGLATRALDDMARLWITGWWLCFAVWVLASRLLFAAAGRRYGALGELRETLAVVGSGGAARQLAARLATAADVVSIAECGLGMRCDVDGVPAPLLPVIALAQHGKLDTVVVAKGPDERELSRLLDCLKPIPVQLAVQADFAGLAGDTAEFRKIGGVTLAIVAERPARAWEVRIKAVLDRLIAAALLVFLAPLLLTVTLLVALDSPGPVIYRQKRNGWAGRMFTIYKFRSMRTQAGGAPRQTERGDTRVTRVGRVLRQSSMDELPQLWNVLLGDMSLVGPRPHADDLHARERAGCTIVEEYARRQRVKPGLTGWAQVNGWRGAALNSAELRQRIEHDLFYIDHWSLLFDLQILVMTPFCLLLRKNAY